MKTAFATAAIALSAALIQTATPVMAKQHCTIKKIKVCPSHHRGAYCHHGKWIKIRQCFDRPVAKPNRGDIQRSSRRRG